MDPVFLYACFVFEQRTSLGQLQRAWIAPKIRWGSKPTWDGMRGPLAATWLSLLQVGWDMRSSTVLITDEGSCVPLITTAPKDVAYILRLSI